MKAHGGRARSVLAALLLMALAACGGGGGNNASGSGEIDPNATLTVAFTVPALPLDPATATSDIAQYTYTNLLYDRLTEILPGSELGPMLATSWEFAPDGMSATFHLRDDVTFSDGETLDANAVKASLDRAVTDPNSTAAARMTMISDIEVVDDFTVKINTNRKAADLPYVLAGSGASIVAPDALGNEDLDAEPVGSGPYVLTELKLGESATFEKRADYWNKEVGLAKTIKVVSIADNNARLNALRSGQADLIFAQLPQADQVENLGPEFSSHVYPAGGNYAMLLNGGKAPLDNQKVRQALNYAVDRDGINEALLSGLCTPSNQALPESFAGYVDSPPVDYNYDPDKARELLSEAGFPNGFTMDMVVGSGLQPQTSIATAIQAQLEEVGVTVELEEVDPVAFVTLYGEENHDSLLTTRLFSASPISSLSTNFLNPRYMPGPVPDELTTLIGDAADPALSADESDQVLQEFSSVVNEQALDVFLCDLPTMFAYSNKVVGADEMGISHFAGIFDLRRVGIEAS